MAMSRDDFERSVGDALDALPDDVLAALDNVVLLVEDEPPAGLPGLLGLYEGVPLTERGADPVLVPDRITIFRGPITRRYRTDAEIRRQVTVTVRHEIAHHFGIGDGRLAELGWG